MTNELIDWDYRWCELDTINCLLKGEVDAIGWAYEEPFVTGRVDADKIYAE